MKAMIFAAGLGTRLRPITNELPKALAPIGNTPILEVIILKLINAGVNSIVINVHHFADKIVDYINSKNSYGIQIQIVHEMDKPLETGGGLVNASEYLTEPFILCNADILHNIDLKAFYEEHIASDALVSLSVQKRDSGRKLIFNENMNLIGWKDTNTGDKIMARESHHMKDYAFNGLHIVQPEIFNLIHKKDTFPIVPEYLEICKTHDIKGVIHADSILDIGTPEKLEEAKKFLS